MNASSKRPAPRSKTPEPNRSEEYPNTRANAPASARTDMRRPFPNRGAKSENDLRRTSKSKETLSKQDHLALSYNAYLQSCFMSLHDAEIRNRKEQEIVNIMEDQQYELIALDEENNYLDLVLMKIQLFKEMKEKYQKKTELYQRVVEFTDEPKLDDQIRMVEDAISQSWLKNFKLPETNDDKKAVLDHLRKIAELLDVIPEIKKAVEPLTKFNASLIKAEEIIVALERSKKECLKKMKLAETLLYDKLYLETRLNKSDERNSGDHAGNR